MSSGRRSQAHAGSEQRRKAQGKIVRAAAAAASSPASLRAAQEEAAAANTDAATATASQTAPVLILPPSLAELWDPSRIVCSTPADTACISAASALLHAREMAAQFMRMHTLAHTIIDAAGGAKGKKGPTKKIVAAATDSAAATEAAPTLSPAVCSLLLDGLVELLCVKLHAQARAPLYLALEALDAVVPGDGGSSLLSRAVDRALGRFAGSPLMAHVIQFEQLSSFPRAFPTLAAQPITVLRGVQRAVDEIVLKPIANMIAGAAAGSAAAAVAAEEEDDDSSAQTLSASAAQWMSPSDQTRFLLRAAVGYILKCRKEVAELFVAAQAPAQEGQPPNRAELCTLVQTISRVLRSPHVHRDVLTQCGLIIAVLLHVSASASVPVKSGAESLDGVMTQAIFATYFAQPGQPMSPTLLRAIPALKWLHSDSEFAASEIGPPIYTRSFEQQLQTLSRLSCARSIISHSSLGVLLSPAMLSSPSHPETLLLSHLVPAVLGHCASINPHIRAYALQTLDVILIRVKAFIASLATTNPPVDAATSGSSASPSPLLPHFSLLLSSILELLPSNFDHPFKAIPGVAKGLFIGYIEVTNMIMGLGFGSSDKQQIEAQREKHWTGFIGTILHRQSANTDAADASSSSISAAVGATAQGASFHTASRGVFTMLSVLLGQVRVLALLQSHPSLLASLFQAGQFRPMFGLATHLVEMILLQAKTEGVTAPKTVEDALTAAGEEGGSAAGAGAGAVSNSRSRQKLRKDVIKQRMKAKAEEIEAVAAGAGALPTTSDHAGLPPATSASASSSLAPSISEPNPLYCSQLASWRALWTPHVVSALFSSNALWRSDVAGGTLSHLLKNVDTEPDALAHVLQAIQAVQIGSAAVANEAASHGDSRVADARREGSLRQLRALVVVLKIARRIGLVTSRYLDTRIRRDGEIGQLAALALSAGPIVTPTSPVSLTRDSFLPITSSQLFAALLHTDLDLRLDVFEFLCSNLQSAEPLSALELGLVRAGLPYLLKAGAPPVRAKFVHCIQRILIRLRDGVHREIREDMAVRDRVAANVSAAAVAGSTSAPVAAAGVSARSNADESVSSAAHLVGVLSAPALSRVGPAFRFFAFFEQFLFDSLYPSAPFERTTAALELYKVLAEAFLDTAPFAAAAAAVDPTSQAQAAGWATSAPVGNIDVWQLRSTLFTREKTCVLINLLASNHERVRLLAFELLERFPAPLPSFEHVRLASTVIVSSASASASASSTSLVPLLRWAMTLCRSPRMRDAEGGALALKLIFRKYVVGLRWCIDYNAMARASAAGAGAAQVTDEYAAFVVAPNAQESILFFFDSLLSFIRFQLSVLDSSEISVRYSDPNSRLHGSLLLFRLLVVDVPWSFWNRCGDGVKQRWIAFTAEMVSTLIRVAEVSLSLHIPTNAAAALRGGSSSGHTAEAQGDRPSTFVNMDCRGHIILPASQQQQQQLHDDQPEGTSTVGGGDDFADQYGEQIVVVSSWLAVKEVSLSLGEWVCTAPLPSSTSAATSSTSVSVSSPFTLADLRRIGSLFFAILSCSKHNGVLENSHEGFLAVVAALLEKHDATLSGIVGDWITQLLDQIAQPWIGESWIRRSRGVAYCLLAILQAEPASSKQPVSEQEVLAMVSGSTTSIAEISSSVASSSMLGRCMIQLMRMAQVETGPAGSADYERGWQLKVRARQTTRHSSTSTTIERLCLTVLFLLCCSVVSPFSLRRFTASTFSARCSAIVVWLWMRCPTLPLPSASPSLASHIQAGRCATHRSSHSGRCCRRRCERRCAETWDPLLQSRMHLQTMLAPVPALVPCTRRA